MTQLESKHYPAIRRKMARMNPSAFAVLVEALMDKPCSTAELARLTGLHEWTVRYYCKALVLRRIAYIAGWLPDSLNRDVTALYALGKGRINVPRRVKTGAQKMRERRAKLRREAEAVNQERKDKSS